MRLLSKIFTILAVIIGFCWCYQLQAALPAEKKKPAYAKLPLAEQAALAHKKLSPEELATIRQDLEKFKKGLKEPEEKEAAEQQIEPRGIFILLDHGSEIKAPDKGTPVTKDLAEILHQKVGPLLVSKSLIHLLFISKKSQFNGWLKAIMQKESLTERLKTLQTCLEQAAFNNDDWIIKKATPKGEWYLFIPKTQLATLGISEDDVASFKEDEKPYGDKEQAASDTERKLGLKINHMPTTSIAQLLEEDLYNIDAFSGYQYSGSTWAKEQFSDQMQNIFCESSKYRSSQVSIPTWSIFMSGHGSIEPQESILGMSLDKFGDVLKFLKEKIHTRFLYYISCYAAGTNAEKLYASLSYNNTYPFTIITQALADAPVVTRRVPNIDFIGFFVEITNPDPIDYERAIDYINPNRLSKDDDPSSFWKHPWTNTPQIMYPGHTNFVVLGNEKAIVSIQPILAMGRKDTAIDICSFFKTDPRVILLYAEDIPELIINTARIPNLNPNALPEQKVITQVDAIISMIPGDAQHTIKKISSQTASVNEILNWFTAVETIETYKLFSINEIQGVTEQTKNSPRQIPEIVTNVKIYSKPGPKDANSSNRQALFTNAQGIQYLKNNLYNPQQADAGRVSNFNGTFDSIKDKIQGTRKKITPEQIEALHSIIAKHAKDASAKPRPATEALREKYKPKYTSAQLREREKEAATASTQRRERFEQKSKDAVQKIEFAKKKKEQELKHFLALLKDKKFDEADQMIDQIDVKVPVDGESVLIKVMEDQSIPLETQVAYVKRLAEKHSALKQERALLNRLLGIATEQQSSDLAQFVLDRGANPNSKYKDQTLFDLAIKLFSAQRDAESWQPNHSPASTNTANNIRSLVEHGAVIDSRNLHANALKILGVSSQEFKPHASNDDLKLAGFLMQRAWLDEFLRYVKDSSFTDAIKLVLADQIDVCAQIPGVKPPILSAFENGNFAAETPEKVTLIQAMVKKGALQNASQPLLDQLLYEAVKQETSTLVTLFLKYGANPQAKPDIHGSPGLYEIVGFASDPAMKTLLASHKVEKPPVAPARTTDATKAATPLLFRAYIDNRSFGAAKELIDSEKMNALALLFGARDDFDRIPIVYTMTSRRSRVFSGLYPEKTELIKTMVAKGALAQATLELLDKLLAAAIQQVNPELVKLFFEIGNKQNIKFDLNAALEQASDRLSQAKNDLESEKEKAKEEKEAATSKEETKEPQTPQSNVELYEQMVTAAQDVLNLCLYQAILLDNIKLANQTMANAKASADPAAVVNEHRLLSTALRYHSQEQQKAFNYTAKAKPYENDALVKLLIEKITAKKDGGYSPIEWGHDLGVAVVTQRNQDIVQQLISNGASANGIVVFGKAKQRSFLNEAIQKYGLACIAADANPAAKQRAFDIIKTLITNGATITDEDIQLAQQAEGVEKPATQDSLSVFLTTTKAAAAK